MRDRASGRALRMPGRIGRKAGELFFVRDEPGWTGRAIRSSSRQGDYPSPSWVRPISATGSRSNSGLELTATRPGLVPLTLSDEERVVFAPLSGVSLPVMARADGASFAESMLINPSRTERSGDPANFFLLARRRKRDARPSPAAPRRGMAARATRVKKHGPGFTQTRMAGALRCRLVRSSCGAKVAPTNTHRGPGTTRAAHSSLAGSARAAPKVIRRPK